MQSLPTIAHALSDPNRVRLLVACLDQERCVCQLVELIDLSNASISKHLATLKNAGLLESRREGRWVHYQTPSTPEAIIADALAFVRIHSVSDHQVQADQIRLAQIDAIDPAELAKQQRTQQRTSCC
ncbi:MAG: winged helix-turn-helix transcriptional regulator [Phycisphaerales bacterium]|nr:winged helix-turn-helix transcriptional regulator [Phycisphaerales bacterium]